MKFREYGEVEPMTVSEVTERLLDERIEQIGRERDIIDLQFATSYIPTENIILYSALLLVKKEA